MCEHTGTCMNTHAHSCMHTYTGAYTNACIHAQHIYMYEMIIAFIVDWKSFKIMGIEYLLKFKMYM